MDIESIKIIADTATQLTGEAKQVFIWWLLGKEVLSMVLHAIVILAVAVMAYRLISRVVGSGSSEGYIMMKRDQFGIGSPGVLCNSERTRTIAEIERRLRAFNGNS